MFKTPETFMMPLLIDWLSLFYGMCAGKSFYTEWA